MAPPRLDDLLMVQTRPLRLGGVRMVLEQKVIRDETVLVVLEVELAVLARQDLLTSAAAGGGKGKPDRLISEQLVVSYWRSFYRPGDANLSPHDVRQSQWLMKLHLEGVPFRCAGGIGSLLEETIMQLSELIVSDSDRMSGAPCFRGTRVPGPLDLIENLAAGMTVEEIPEMWPSLERDDVLAVLELAGEEAERHAAKAA